MGRGVGETSKSQNVKTSKWDKGPKVPVVRAGSDQGGSAQMGGSGLAGRAAKRAFVIMVDGELMGLLRL